MGAVPPRAATAADEAPEGTLGPSGNDAERCETQEASGADTDDVAATDADACHLGMTSMLGMRESCRRPFVDAYIRAEEGQTETSGRCELHPIVTLHERAHANAHQEAADPGHAELLVATLKDVGAAA